MGQTFGENGIFKPTKRMENAKALEGTVVLQLTKEDLLKFK